MCAGARSVRVYMAGTMALLHARKPLARSLTAALIEWDIVNRAIPQ